MRTAEVYFATRTIQGTGLDPNSRWHMPSDRQRAEPSVPRIYATMARQIMGALTATASILMASLRIYPRGGVER